MRVLSIDPGYDRLGIAVIEAHKNKKESLIYSDCVTTHKENTFYERLGLLVDVVKKTINTHEPEVLSIETLYMSKNQKTAMRVAEVRGAIIQCAYENKLRICEYTPLEVKVAVCGHGRGDKKQVMDMIPKLINLRNKHIHHDDEYDAIAIGLTCLAVEKLD